MIRAHSPCEFSSTKHKRLFFGILIFFPLFRRLYSSVLLKCGLVIYTVNLPSGVRKKVLLESQLKASVPINLVFFLKWPSKFKIIPGKNIIIWHGSEFIFHFVSKCTLLMKIIILVVFRKLCAHRKNSTECLTTAKTKCFLNRKKEANSTPKIMTFNCWC